MMNDDVEVSGITPKNRLPKCDRFSFCKEFVETDKCCIPSQKPDIYEICNIAVKVDILETNTICTPMGYKVIITGHKYIKVMYSTDDCSSRVHSAHFNIPFTEFILLEDDLKDVKSIESAIEYISACQNNKRSFYVSTLILLCVKVRENCKFNYEKGKCKKYLNEYDCDCECECGDYDESFVEDVECNCNNSTCKRHNEEEEDDCWNKGKYRYYKWHNSDDE